MNQDLQKETKIGILGLTHLGCVLCASWSKLGFKTVGVDLDEKIVNNLNENIPPIFEPGLEEAIRQGISLDTLRFSSDISLLSSCDFIFFGYDTEVDEQDAPDTSYIEARMHQIGPILKENAIVIVSSQLPAGYSRLFRTILQKYRPTLELAYSPENLQLGQAIHCYLHPERIILGMESNEALDKTLSLFSIITQNVAVMSLESAEIVKHGINSFLAMSIVFSNQLADVCEKFPDTSIADVIKGIKSDVRIGAKAYLSPGIGFSGGTLGRDVAVLGQILKDDETNFFDFIHLKNRNRKEHIIQKLKKTLHSLKDRTIGVLGITYKPGTSTLRRSLPLEIVQILVEEGAKVKVFDPKADYSPLQKPTSFIQAVSIENAAEDADLLLLLTEWPEFKEFEWSKIKPKMKSPILFDGKNALDRTKLVESGFVYQGIGDSL
jgi:UDPglucose 6-dehydrogenase